VSQRGLEREVASSDIELQREKLNAIGEILRCAHLRDEFEIIYAATDGYVELMRVDHAGERNPAALPSRRLGQQVLVLAEKHTAERCGTVQQIWIIDFGTTICLSRQDINPSVQQYDRYCPPDMDIHVQRQAHSSAQLTELFEALLKWRFAGL
jgi:hypothetical protein